MTKPVFVCKAKGPVVSKRSGKPSKPDKLGMAKRISENLAAKGRANEA